MKGWYRESERHSLASKGVKTERLIGGISINEYTRRYRRAVPIADPTAKNKRLLKEAGIWYVNKKGKLSVLPEDVHKIRVVKAIEVVR